jgi:UDP-N-acetylmuramate--alanine ligase
MTQELKPQMNKAVGQAMRRIKQIHFIGIGGAGMSGIAEVLLNQGYRISGSDIKASNTTQRLTKLGANIFIGHQAEQIDGADVIVVSSIIDETNPEVIAARAARIPVIPRAEMLAELMRFQYGIAVGGTHGKTTTTSLAATLLIEAGLDPTYVIGGLLNSAGSNAYLGASRYFVAEADESDASFLYLKPMVTIVTNIDADHMSTYGNDFECLKKTFLEFLHHLPFYGLAILCIDDPVIRSLLPQIARPIITYGFSEDADIRASDFKQQGLQTHFTVNWKDKVTDLKLMLNLAGKHNVLNALASIVVAHDAGVEWDVIKNALAKFAGVGRRFQIHGDFQYDNGKVTLVDDYGHHPNEVAAVIAAAREAWPDRRLVMAYQPHRYTRTHDLFNDFVKVLATVDELVLLDIYSAGEKPIPGADGKHLWQALCDVGKVSGVFVENGATIEHALGKVLHPNDVLLMQGAGDIGAMAVRLAKNQLSLTVET